MADKVIGELPSISYLDSGSLFVAEQNGEAVKVSGKQLTDFANVETAAQVEQAKVSAQAAQAAKESAEAAILKGPIIQNGTWWVYNQTAGVYQNTGINATGPQGIPGPTASVNGVTPDASGNVNVTASDVKMPDGTTTVKEAFDDMVHAVSQLVNPNLLDNWYFPNPVNQRGVTSGTAGWNKYFLDRWQGNCIYDVTKGYLEVGDGSYVVQRIENGGSIPYPVTFSILFQDGTFGYQTVYADGGFELIGENIKGFADSQIHGENPYISYNNNSGSTVGIIAVKLELGTVQTLAHQDANGNWVLNEIPDYGEQLSRCQRYFRKSIWSVVTRNSGTYWPVAYDATGMRALPSCTIEQLCYIGHTNRDPGASDVMHAQSNYGSILLFANLPTLDSYYPGSTSCGIIFTLSADL